MIKDVPPPTEAEEYRSMAEILRELAAQVQFGATSNALVSLANNLDRMAVVAERHIPGELDWSLSPAPSKASSLNANGPGASHTRPQARGVLSS